MMGLLGKKKGMSQMFGKGGEMIPVTVIEAGPCVVVQKKTKENDGYTALQLGFEVQKPKRISKALLGHFAKNKVPNFKHLREFYVPEQAEIAVGQEITVGAFRVGDTVSVSGITKGRGFQGVIKRHGKHGGPASHGSDFHRRTGSIGMRTWPARVLKGTRLPGHMGVNRVTTRNLEVVAVMPDQNVLMVRGAVPGTREGIVEIVSADPQFALRTELKNEKTTNA